MNFTLISQIPPDTQQDDFSFKVPPFERVLQFMNEVGWTIGSRYKCYFYQTTIGFTTEPKLIGSLEVEALEYL